MGLAWLLPSSSPTFSIFTRKCCLRKFHFMAKATSLAWQTDPQNDFPRLWGNINFNLPVFQFNVAINKIPLFNRCFQCKAIFLLQIVISFYSWPIAKIKHLQSCYFTIVWNSLKALSYSNAIALQVNNHEIIINFFHISHNLTWYSAIVHKFTRIYPVCSL